jgi:hypothetical protein
MAAVARRNWGMLKAERIVRLRVCVPWLYVENLLTCY